MTIKTKCKILILNDKSTISKTVILINNNCFTKNYRWFKLNDIHEHTHLN